MRTAKRRQCVAIFIFAIIVLAACNDSKQKAEENPSSKVAASTVVIAQGSLDLDRYNIASSATWIVGDDTFLGAFIETRKNLADKISPPSRILIKNLSSNATLYQRDIEGLPLSMYVRNVTPDPNPELIVSWDIAAASNQFQIFAVSPAQAKLMFDENYRLDATLLDLGEDEIDVLLTTGEGGSGPFVTTLYGFRGGKYELLGEVPYEAFISPLRNLATQSKKPTSVR